MNTSADFWPPWRLAKKPQIDVRFDTPVMNCSDIRVWAGYIRVMRLGHAILIIAALVSMALTSVVLAGRYFVTELGDLLGGNNESRAWRINDRGQIAGYGLFDPDGTGAAAAVQFATLATGLALTNNDFVVA